MKRMACIILVVVIFVGSVQAQVVYRIPQLRSSTAYLRLPYARDRGVQWVQTVGIIGLEAYKTGVIARHGDRAIDMARRDQELRYRQQQAQQVQYEMSLQEMEAKVAEIKAKQEAKALRAQIEKQRLENQLLQEQLRNQELRERLNK